MLKIKNPPVVISRRSTELMGTRMQRGDGLALSQNPGVAERTDPGQRGRYVLVTADPSAYASDHDSPWGPRICSVMVQLRCPGFTAGMRCCA